MGRTPENIRGRLSQSADLSMMGREDLFRTCVETAAKECGRKFVGSFVYKMYVLRHLFANISFAGKSMIDIGSGCGLYSFCAASLGAAHVLSIEPEIEGSRHGVLEKFRRVLEILMLPNIELQTRSFQEFDPGDQRFDIILSHNSINHLDEDACIKLGYDHDARQRYNAIFEKLGRIAAPGARLIVVDCSRENFFASIGLKSPFAPTIEWDKHQSPEFWSKMLSSYGFINPKIRWISLWAIPPNRIFGNRFMSYLSTSQFLLVMDKRIDLLPKRSNAITTS